MRFTPGESGGIGSVNSSEFKSTVQGGIEKVIGLRKEFLKIQDNPRASELLEEINKTISAKINKDPLEISDLVERANGFLSSLKAVEDQPVNSASNSSALERVSNNSQSLGEAFVKGKDWSEGKERTPLMIEIENLQSLFGEWSIANTAMEEMVKRLRERHVSPEIYDRFNQLGEMMNRSFKENGEIIKLCLLQMSKYHDGGREDVVGMYQDLRKNLKSKLNEDRSFIAAWSKHFGIMK